MDPVSALHQTCQKLKLGKVNWEDNSQLDASQSYWESHPILTGCKEMQFPTCRGKTKRESRLLSAQAALEVISLARNQIASNGSFTLDPTCNNFDVIQSAVITEQKEKEKSVTVSVEDIINYILLHKDRYKEDSDKVGTRVPDELKSSPSPITILTTYAMKNKIAVWFDTESNGPSHAPVFQMKVHVGDKEYGPCMAGSKKDAKFEISLKACVDLGLVTPDLFVEGKAKPVQGVTGATPTMTLHAICQKYRLPFNYQTIYSSMNEQTVSLVLDSLEVSRGTGRTLKQAKIEAAGKVINLIIEAVEDVKANSFPKLNSSGEIIDPFAEHMVTTCWTTYSHVRQAYPDFCLNPNPIMSCIVLENCTKGTLTVVSMATGNKIIPVEHIPVSGESVLDCHAEVLVRRGLMKFMYNQVERHRQGNSSVFTGSSPPYSLKSEYRIHLYISKTPCGDAAVFVRSDQRSIGVPMLLPKDHAPVYTNPTAGFVRTKLEGGEGTIPVSSTEIPIQTIDAISLGKRMKIMSCSDKILKWNVLGLQGALLSHLVKPIYLSSVTVTDLYSSKHLCRALCCRVGSFQPSCATAGYTLNHPALYYGVSSNTKRMISTDITQKLAKVSINWVIPNEVDVTNKNGQGVDLFQSLEVTDVPANRITAVNRVGSEFTVDNVTESQLSKRMLLAAFVRVCDNIQRDLGYYDLKMQANSYQVCKREFYDFIESRRLGRWVMFSSELDHFDLRQLKDA